MMLRRINIVFGLLIVLLFFQCRPIEIVPDINGTPVFFIHAETGTGDSLHFVAGLNHYELITSYEQIDGVYVFIGEFKKEADQTDSLASLRFEIRDVAANIPIDIENALMQPSYSLLNENLELIFDTTYMATFTAEPLNCPLQLPPASYKWTEQGTIIGNGVEFIKVFNDSNDQIIKLTLDYGSGLQTSTEQNFSFTNTTPFCGLEINAEVIQNDFLLELNTVPTGTFPFTYLWDTEDTTPAIAMPIDSFIHYSVSVTDANGCIAIASGDVPDNVLQDELCTVGFTYTTDIQIEMDTIISSQYSTVTIIYTNVNGQEYRSDFEGQDINSFFNIQMIDDFPNNDNGEKTKKINIDFAADLFSPTEGIISLQSNGGVLGVAYPE